MPKPSYLRKAKIQKNQSQPQPFHYEMFLLAHLPLPAEQLQSDIEPESVIRTFMLNIS